MTSNQKASDIASGLTAGEIEALMKINTFEAIEGEMIDNLKRKGLIVVGRRQIDVTETGRAVLSAHATPPATGAKRPTLGDTLKPNEEAGAGGRYRLRRWDAESSEWKDGVSQPWDTLKFAVEQADAMANRDGERYMVIDRLYNPVYETQATGVKATEASKVSRQVVEYLKYHFDEMCYDFFMDHDVPAGLNTAEVAAEIVKGVAEFASNLKADDVQTKLENGNVEIIYEDDEE